MAAALEIKESYRLDDLVRIVEILRAPNGCPWDREQNHHSMRKNFIEEVYEAVEAIDTDDTALLREELGDVLLQIVFHAGMEQEVGSFSFDDVCDGICKKLIRRHPHVFGDVVANDSKEAFNSWEAVKREEKGHRNAASVIDSVSQALPALMRADKIGARAAKAGFDHECFEDAFDHLKSEICELQEAIAGNDAKAVEDELGDVLFAVVNIARHKELDPEHALSLATDKFSRRFRKVEAMAAEREIDMKTTGMNVLDSLWEEAKK